MPLCCVYSHVPEPVPQVQSSLLSLHGVGKMPVRFYSIFDEIGQNVNGKMYFLPQKPLLNNDNRIERQRFQSTCARERICAEKLRRTFFRSEVVDQGLECELQSAYKRHYSTETALLKVKNDLLMSMNNQRVTLLVLLDLSAAFDIVCHQILVDRLPSKFRVSGTALEWLRSYLSKRSQRVSVKGVLSDGFDLRHGVPQGSCLGPLLFSLYTSKLFDITKIHLLNDSKTEILLVGSRQQLRKVELDALMVGTSKVPLASSAVRNLGSWFDSEHTMNTHVNKLCSAGYFHLYFSKVHTEVRYPVRSFHGQIVPSQIVPQLSQIVPQKSQIVPQ